MASYIKNYETGEKDDIFVNVVQPQTEMKICVAQTRPIKGNIQRNIENHKRLIELSCISGAEIIVFPELSLTGYEPELAKDLAIDMHDSRLDEFQEISDYNQIVICVGAPTRSNDGICISMILFRPHHTRQLYSKRYLHADEEPFFVSGENIVPVKINGIDLAFAICYELSIPEHAKNAFNQGAKVYIASVAKSASGVQKASGDLANIAKMYSMTVLMSNCVGYCDNFDSIGKTAAWNSKGVLLGNLSDTQEGILIIDTASEELVEKLICSSVL